LDFATKYAKARGCKFFHLGGGNTSSEKDSLFIFKSNFSNNLMDFFIGKKIHNQQIYDKILGLWQKMYNESFNKNKSKLLGYRDIN